MSPIGRIFLVLNLILAAAFLGWAANALATSQEYKTKWEEEQTLRQRDVDMKAAEIGELQVQLTQSGEDQRRFREERDQLQAAHDRLQTQLAEAGREKDQLGADLTRIAATLNDYNETIAQITASKDRATEQANEALAAKNEAMDAQQAAEMAKRDAEETLTGAQTQIGDLETAIASAREQIDSLTAQLETLFRSNPSLSRGDYAALPQIEGMVLETRLETSPGLVMLNIGADKDVKVGYTFEVYRGGQYKGTVRVQNVQARMSSAIIERMVNGATIARGDQVATHL